MNSSKTIKLLSALWIPLLCLSGLQAGPQVILTNKKGTPLEAELLYANETSVKVRRKSDGKVFDLSLSTLDERSIRLIEKHRKKLSETYPSYDASLVIGKRSVDKDRTFDTKIQTVTSTIRITNTDRAIPSPEVKGRVLFFGKNQNKTGRFKILATRDFTISPAPEKTVELELSPFETEYYANYSGFKYEGYLLVLYKEDTTALYHKTTNAHISKVLEENADLLETYRTISEDLILEENLLPLDRRGRKKGPDVININE